LYCSISKRIFSQGNKIYDNPKPLSGHSDYFILIGGHSKAYNGMGAILARQGNYKKACVFFSKAIQIDSNYTEARKNLEILKKTLSSHKP